MKMGYMPSASLVLISSAVLGPGTYQVYDFRDARCEKSLKGEGEGNKLRQNKRGLKLIMFVLGNFLWAHEILVFSPRATKEPLSWHQTDKHLKRIVGSCSNRVFHKDPSTRANERVENCNPST